jgi:uridine kinase
MPLVTVSTLEVPNWEVFESLDWDLFLTDLSSARASPLTIVEGFILFAHPRVQKLCDILITLKFDDSEFSIAMERRLRRDQGENVPPNYREEPLASKSHFLANYFEQIIWPEMIKHPEYIDPIGWKKPKLVLKATDEITAIQVQAEEFLHEALKKPRCEVM